MPRRALITPRPGTYSLPEAAAKLGISYSTARNHARLYGHICGFPIIRNGRHWRVARGPIDRYLAGEGAKFVA